MYDQNYASAVASCIELCEGRGDTFFITDLVAYNASISEGNNRIRNFKY